MRIAVIGGKGQIGNYLLPMLVHEGHEVVSVCRGNIDYFRDAPEFAEVKEAHLNRLDDDFAQRVAELGCDVVVDIICFTQPQAQAMVEALADSVEHYVCVGSIWIHGHATSVPLFEDECRTPTDTYGKNKLAITDYLKEQWETRGFPATIVHPGHIVAPGFSSIVGPQGNRDLGVIEALRDGREVTLPNMGLETLHHVHAGDVAGIIDAVIRMGRPTFGEEYHAVSQRAITLRGFCEEVAALWGKEAVLRFLPFDEFAKGVSPQDAADTLEHISRSPSCSPTKALRELGYLSRTTMETIREHLVALGMLSPSGMLHSEMGHKHSRVSIFNRKAIAQNCNEFYSIYDETEGMTHDMCQAKIIHTRFVAQNCNDIARSLKLDDYDTDLAWIIGELHDYARLGQIVVTHTFKDSDEFNHAKVGARLLFERGMVEDIIPNYSEVGEEDREVMRKAVAHHSDFHLPTDLSRRERMFCQLIRDADQLDIFRTIVESGWKTIYGRTKEEILASDFSPEITEAFYRHELADYSKRKTPADFHLAHIALCFGLQSRAAHLRVLEQGYLRQMMDIEFTQPEVQRTYEGLVAEVEAYLGS
ncbi:MAG: NAD-dependent epimerase/dehydratase family protein [Coriobacteriales bacterium]|nr:NAD-dependent epimerase/dehydratase family protein [Coriobacteriales bacterium]